MNPTSVSKGIILMLVSIIFFTVNTLAVRALALTTMMINRRASKATSKKLTTQPTNS